MKKIEILWQYKVVFCILSILLFVVPLYVLDDMPFPFTTGKSLVFIGGSLLAGVFYFWGKIKDSTSTISLGFNSLILFLFSAVLIVTSINGLVPKYSFFGGYNGFGALLILSGILFAFLFAAILRLKKEYIFSFLKTILASSVLYVLSVYGGDNLFKGSADAGSIGNTSYAGAYLLIVLFIALAFVLISRNRWEKIFAWVSLVFVIFSPIFFNINIFKGIISLKDIIANPLVLSGPANGAVFGVAVGVFTSLSVFLIRSKKKFIQWGGLLLLVGVFSGLWFAGQALVNPETKLHQFYVADKNANRFIFWDIAYAGVNEKPLLGWGMNAYTYIFQEKFDPIFYSPGYFVELWTDNPHNMIAEYAVSTGYVGLFIYLSVIGGAGIVLFRASNSEDKTRKVVSILLFGALAGYVVQNFFVFDTVVPFMMFSVIIGYALFVQKDFFVANSKNVVYKTIFILSIAALLYLFFAGFVMSWAESKKTVEYARSDLKVLNTKNPQFISGFGYAGNSAVVTATLVNYYVANMDGKKIDVDVYENFKSVMIKNVTDLEDSIKADGVENFRSYWLIGQVYIKLFELGGRADVALLEKSRTYLLKAIEINPNNPDVLYNMSATYLAERDFRSTEKWLRAYIALAPEYQTGYRYAQQLIDRKLATKEFEQYILRMRTVWCHEESLCASK